jgi:hypothetical protein
MNILKEPFRYYNKKYIFNQKKEQNKKENTKKNGELTRISSLHTHNNLKLCFFVEFLFKMKGSDFRLAKNRRRRKNFYFQRRREQQSFCVFVYA